MKSDALFSFAGLHERWKPAEGEPIETFTIGAITTPNPLMARIHNRMPVILREIDYDRWLDGRTQMSCSNHSMWREADMDAYAVSMRAVNSPEE